MITTDGLENASRHYDIDRVKSMIERRKKKYGWEVMFLGANIDAVETAGWIGIDADRAVNYRCDGIGTALNFEVLSDAISDVRADEELTPQWKKESTRTSVPGAAEKNKGEWTCLRPVWAPPPASGGPYSGAICSPPPQRLAAPSRGAKSSHRVRAAACHRRPFQRRDLLPTPGKALRHRPGEQNLHRNSAPPLATGGLFSGAICSPLPAKPCGTVPGSKIFTEIPRRRLPPATFTAAQFAPRSPQSLAASSRGAKSSHRFRAAACLRRLFQRRDLLPAPRKGLRLRSGEQNLHIDSAPPPASGGLFKLDSYNFFLKLY